VTLLARAAAASPRTGWRQAVGIGLSDQLDAALRVAGIEVLRVAGDLNRGPTADSPRDAISLPDAAASLVVWVPAAASPYDVAAWLSEIARVLSLDGEAIVAWDPTPDGAERTFAEAGFQVRRVAAGHVLPGPGQRLTDTEPTIAAWSLRQLRGAKEPPTTAALAGRIEAELFAALAVAGTHLEATREHLEAVAASWEQAHATARRRRVVRAADAA
jgi:hypothetical protein